MVRFRQEGEDRQLSTTESASQIKRALVSVYDKTGLDELARGLHEAGVEIVSTGSTAAVIAGAGVPVTKVEELTGFPECLDGRVKTLHPNVHAGLLADLTRPEHEKQLDELGIKPFQLLVSNLYPFESTVASGAPAEQCVEEIDIGGPAMVRGAGKNHANVAAVTSPLQYAEVLAALRGGGFTMAQRQRLDAGAFALTARYDSAVASWFASSYAPDEPARENGWPDFLGDAWSRSDILRYGENPHQRAALYVRAAAGPELGDGGIATAEQLHGKAMSNNNYVDADAARRAAYDFAEPCAAIIKHSNPCGIAIGADLAEAHRKANACDPQSAFGGVIAVNGPVTAELAGQIAEIFTEVVVAPAYDDQAREILSQKKNIRLLVSPPPERGPRTEWRQVSGGLLVQATDLVDQPGDDPAHWELKTGERLAQPTLVDLAFAWRAVRSVKSNAILLASDGATVGVGMGQVNRVDSCRLAVDRAGERAPGSGAASVAFSPFARGPGVLIEAGVRAIVEPGGSIRDDDTIAACTAAGVSLYFTGT